MIKISPSKIMMYEVCPKQLHFQYILKIPQDEKDYFEYWKNCEALIMEMIYEKEDNPIEKYWVEVVKLANAIYENKKFQELIKWKELIYQREYKNDDIHWFSDIETDDTIIDIKTSSVKWNKETIEKYKYQAMTYLKYSWKKNFYFVIWNKKTYEVQVIKVRVKDFKPLEQKIIELKLAFEMWIFPAKPWFHCKNFCSFNQLCDKQ
jgi:hypothetical protein